MNILISGATSLIGAEIAKRFSSGNSLYLIARNSNDLAALVETLNPNSENVSIVECDLSDGNCQTIDLLNDQVSFDLFVSIASATSRTRDSSLDALSVRRHANVDLISPINIAMTLIKKKPEGKKLNVIFLSTVLTSLISPDRRVYSSYKTLQQEYLSRLSKDKVKLMLVEIATFISPEKASDRTKELANQVYSGYQNGRRKVTFGFSGRVLKGIYYLHPLLYFGLIKSLRLVRKLLNDPIK